VYLGFRSIFLQNFNLTSATPAPCPLPSLLSRQKKRVQNQGCQIFLVQHTKMGKNIYQINMKYTKLLHNIPNSSKVDQTTVKITNIFLFKTLQNLPKLGFLVWEYAIWQPCPESALQNLFSKQMFSCFFNASVVSSKLIGQHLPPAYVVAPRTNTCSFNFKVTFTLVCTQMIR
jgi:hypothetical protein